MKVNLISCDVCGLDIPVDELVELRNENSGRVYDFHASCLIPLRSDKKPAHHAHLPDYRLDALSYLVKSSQPEQPKEEAPEPPKKSRKKKEEPVDAVPSEEAVIKALALDMRDKLNAKLFEQAKEQHGLDYRDLSGMLADYQATMAHLADETEFNPIFDQHKDMLKEMLEQRGFDFNVESYIEKAVQIRGELVERNVKMKDLLQWVNELTAIKPEEPQEFDPGF